MMGSPLAAITRLLSLQASFSFTNKDALSKVQAGLESSSQKSWELGTEAEALTELLYPNLSVFSPSGFPPVNFSKQNATSVLAIAHDTVKAKPESAMALIAGQGATGDPASIGVAVILANWTRTDLSDDSYAVAASQQLKFLLDVAPRSSSGAISHRTNQVQLWADFVYMAPPFIAFYGLVQGGDAGQELLQAAYDQCRLYRKALRDADSGLWKHIVLGSFNDNHHWGTGNGWAAAGMIRVLESIRQSDANLNMTSQKADLTSWVKEIVQSSWKHQTDEGALLNYIDESDSFADSSSTALIASATYRLATITGDDTDISCADKAMAYIEKNIDSDGWLLNTVDPYKFSARSKKGTPSPEGQAFVILLYAAWRDYQKTASVKVAELPFNGDVVATSTTDTAPTDTAIADTTHRRRRRLH